MEQTSKCKEVCERCKTDWNDLGCPCSCHSYPTQQKKRCEDCGRIPVKDKENCIAGGYHDISPEEAKEDWDKIVFEVIGGASMCWSSDRFGTFDSESAHKIGNKLIRQIKLAIESAREDSCRTTISPKASDLVRQQENARLVSIAIGLIERDSNVEHNQALQAFIEAAKSK